MKKRRLFLLPLILLGMTIAGCTNTVNGGGKKDDTPVQPEPSGGGNEGQGGEGEGSGGEEGQGGEQGSGGEGSEGGEGSGGEEGQGGQEGGGSEGGEGGGSEGGEGGGSEGGGSEGGEGGEGQGGETQVTLSSIAITHAPNKLAYYCGDELELEGLVVTATYSDGHTAVIPNSELTISGFNSNEPNESVRVVVSYQGQTTYFTVSVIIQSSTTIPAHVIHIINSEGTHNVQLTSDNAGNWITSEVELREKEEFKIKMSIDDSDWRGYSALVESATTRNNFEVGRENDNIAVKAGGSGSYSFVISEVANNEGKSINVEKELIPDHLNAQYNGGEFLVGSKPNMSQIQVYVIYTDTTASDNVAEQASMYLYDNNHTTVPLADFNFVQAGDYTVHVEYQSLSTTFELHVIEQFVANTDYYLKGAFNGWEARDNFKLTAGTKTEGNEGNGVDALKEGKQQYFIKDVQIEEKYRDFKFFQNKQSIDGNDSWWPGEGQPNLSVPEAGTYDFYFVPEGGISEWGGGFYYAAKHTEAKVPTGIEFVYSGPDIVQGNRITDGMSLKFVYENGDKEGVGDQELANCKFYLDSDLEHDIPMDYIFNDIGTHTLTCIYKKGDLQFSDYTTIKIVASDPVSTVEYTFYLNVNGPFVMVDDTASKQPGDTWEHQYIYKFDSLVAGFDISFYKDDGEHNSKIDNVIVENPNGAIRYNENTSAYEIVTNETDYTIYLKTYSNGEYKLWCGDANQIPYLRGSFHAWILDDNYQLVDSGEQKEGHTQYVIRDVDLSQDDELKIYAGGTWYPSTGNYVVDHDGTYDIYFVKEGVSDPLWYAGYIFLYEHIEITGINFEYNGPDIVVGHAIETGMTLEFTYSNGTTDGFGNEDMSHTQFFVDGGTEPVTTGYIFNSVGDHTIKAVYNYNELHFEDETTVTVVASEVKATAVELDKDSANLLVGDKVTLNTELTPDNVTNPTISWASDNESVATVDANGEVIAVALGDANITATCGDVSDTCVIHVVELDTSVLNIVFPNRGAALIDKGTDGSGKHQYGNDNLTFREGEVVYFTDAAHGINFIAPTIENSANMDVSKYIRISDDGTRYEVLKNFNADVYLKIDDSGNPVSVYLGYRYYWSSTIGLIGEINGVSDWEDDVTQLTATDNTYSTFEVENLTIEAGDKLKLRRDGMWDYSWGYSDVDLEASVKGVLTSDGDGNIIFEKGGEFTFSFSVTTGKITIIGTPDVDPNAVPAHTLRVFTQDADYPLIGKDGNTEYYFEDLYLEADDVFKIKMSDEDSDWRGFTNIKTGGSSANFSKANESDDIQCDVTGHYNVYVTVDKNSGGEGLSIWISEYHAPADLVEFSVTGVDAGWTSSSDYYVWAWGGDAGTGYKYDATLEDSTIKAMLPENIDGFLVLKVEKDKVWDNSKWSTNLEAQSRNITVEDSVLSYSFTVAAASQVVTLDATFATQGNEVWYAYVWGEGVAAKWVEVGNDGTVEVGAEYTKVIFVRLDKSKDNNPNWDNCWNQTEDLTIQDGQTYTISSWTGGAGGKLGGSWN